MPSATLDSHGVAAVAAFRSFLDDLLSRAESVKQTASVEPPLDKSDFGDLQGQLSRILGDDAADAKKLQRFAVIETAARDTFSHLIATISIDSPAFVQVWNLFDILSILSDCEQCDPALLFWLVEELLDSQTIAGCRKVFDFLESRRERITTKHFKQKQLVILRTCNELLRRLSRALDPAFCGRVFIFMFQSFPLGDKSSVNLRGEYHVENVTTFDQEPLNTVPSSEKMDVDIVEERAVSKGSDGKKQPTAEKPLEPDALYPIFWPLQESYNQPKKLFDPQHFAAFKTGLEATMATFRSIKPEQISRSKEKLDKQVEENKGSLKRKSDDDDDKLAGSFNPKYLTSRDLFKLEISDLAFRRNILVQALIVMEFLLSLSHRAKEKLSTVKAPNKSVTYSDQLLSEEDTKWVTEMKRMIAEYLKQGAEGPYFYRMVETVLSRDKNWVRWKIENCPSIELPPVSPKTFVDARTSAAKLASTKRLRATPMGSLPLDFLDDTDDGAGAMERLKGKGRYALPELDTFRRGIANDDFEIEMPTNNETKAVAVEAKASKSWRALRIASGYKLATFDRIDSDDKIDAIFEENTAQEPSEEIAGDAEDAADAVFPEDRRPVVIVDAATTAVAADSKLGMVASLVAQHPGTFGSVPAHVTRKPEEGEASGRDYVFVDTLAFNMMRDGDQFLAFTEGGEGGGRGISRRSVEAISEGGKVPVLELDQDGAQQVKDLGFDARLFLVGSAAESTETGFYDSVVENNLEALTAAIFGTNTEAENQDVAMDDPAPEAA